jgi:4a-hydroxytetrahydrobiopterin dehydratase
VDDSLTRQQISDAVDPLGWRLILGAVVTHVRVPSLSAAAEAAVAAVSAVGADGDGHLSLDLHADRVVLGLQTAATGFVTEHDVRLATPRSHRRSRSPSTHSTSP